jgi:8-oxo-dGTP pyrophosphatase MutT (NUDIX family)
MMQRTRKAVGAIVYSVNQERFLLVKKKSVSDTLSKTQYKIRSYWDFPKGGIKIGETAIAALKRELKEELGIVDFMIIKKLPYALNFSFTKNIRDIIGFNKQSTILYYVEIQNRKIVLDKTELEKYSFFTYKQAIKRLEKEESKKVFMKLIKFIK